jgi:glutathione S-transferase
MTRVYYRPRTRATRALWMLEELDLQYDAILVAPDDRESSSYLARQPLGRVPAIDFDDGTTMFESAAICLQLADSHPEGGLIGPPGSTERARAYQWIFFAVLELEVPLIRAIQDFREGTSEGPSRARFLRAAEVFADALGADEWIIENRFSVADVICVGVLSSAYTRGMVDEWPPSLVRYVERGEARPARQAAVER